MTKNQKWLYLRKLKRLAQVGTKDLHFRLQIAQYRNFRSMITISSQFQRYHYDGFTRYLCIGLLCSLLRKSGHMIDDWSCIRRSVESNISQSILIGFYHSSNAITVWILRVTV